MSIGNDIKWIHRSSQTHDYLYWLSIINIRYYLAFYSRFISHFHVT